GAQGLPAMAMAAPEGGMAAPGGATYALYGRAATADPVGPGDLLDVRVFGQPQLSATLRVGPAGEIAPPFLDRLDVAGQTPAAIQTDLAKAYAGILTAPLVSVRLLENNSRRVSINGAVPRPGVYTFSGNLTLLQALGLAGGLDPTKASPDVLLFHQPPVTARTNAQARPAFTANSERETMHVDILVG